jgi:hypothetical protein
MILDRYITTDISAAVVASLLARDWTVERIAEVIDAPVSFIRGVQAKKNVFTMKDLRRLGRQTRQTAELMVFDAMRPSRIKPELKELFESTRALLETSSSVRAEPSQRRTKKRRSRIKAA